MCALCGNYGSTFADSDTDALRRTGYITDLCNSPLRLLSLYGATVSTVVYVLLGAVGVPVFSGFKGGIASIVGPTGGFIIGFIAMAAISGIAFRNMPEKFRIPLRIAMGILGVAACHICGFVQYALVAGKDLLSSFLLVSAPYLIKDIASVVLAYFAALAISKALKRTGFAPSEQA